VCTTVGYTFAKSEMPDILHIRPVRKYFRWSETKLPPEEADLTPEEADLTPREAEMPPETNLTPDDLATLQDAKMTPWDAILPPRLTPALTCLPSTGSEMTVSGRYLHYMH